MMRKFLFLISLLALILNFVSCQKRYTIDKDSGGDTIEIRYARHLVMVKHSGYTEVTLANPWKKNTVLHRYLLVPKGSEGNKTAQALRESKMEASTDIVRTPIAHSVVFTSPHCQLLYDLGSPRSIVGVCDLPYINISDIKHRVETKDIVDCGSSMTPDIERIIDIHPEALLISPFENSGGFGKLEKLHIPIIETADYMETSPLGRAEWMKFYGLLFADVGRADSLFTVIEKKYNDLKQMASKLPKGRSILTERKMGSVWYVPGGESTMGVLLRDANATYIFAEDKHSGSLALSPERVLDKAKDIDVWAFKYFESQPLGKRQLLQEYQGYASLKAFTTGDIYGCNTMQIPYFEKTSFRPEVLLREFILLAHPKEKGLGGLNFYQKL